MSRFGGLGTGPDVINRGIGDVVDAIQDGLAFIKDFLDNTGKYCVNVLNGGLEIFQNFVNSAVEILTKDANDPMFGDFWTVINRVSSVLCVIASTVMVMLFLINMCTEAWDTRHDMELWTIVKQLVKMVVAVILVNNALTIVTAIFSMGARVAQIITLTDPSNSIQIAEENARLVKFGVSGMNGMLTFVVYIIASLVVIATGIIITLEIYQRVFKMYVLIPFSTISFTTFVMGDNNRGNEVFHGYLKTILSTAAEAVVIMMCVSFCYNLIESGQTMNDLLGLNEVTVDIECYSPDDVMAVFYGVNGEYSFMYDGDITPSVKSQLTNLIDNGNDYASVVVNDSIKGLFKAIFGYVDYPCTVTVYREADWKATLLIALSVVFPCILCAGAVKQAGHYSNMIFGR